MRSFYTKIFFNCLFVFASYFAGAQAKFTATVSPEQAGRDEYVTLKFTVANGSNIRQITPPSFNDFSVVSGPNQETEMNSVNGMISQYVSLSYVLLPKKTGTLTLGAGIAVIDGKTYKSAPLEVRVSNKKSSGRSQQNNLSSLFQLPLTVFDPFSRPKESASFDDYVLRKGENVPEKVNRNMQLKLQTNKTSCFIGEPLLATYKLYTRLQSESNLSKNPSFNGFSVIDMMQNDPISSARETLNGREYNAYTIRKAQLYPLQAGAVELESATLDNKISFLKNNNGSDEMVTENVSLSSKPVTIMVRALPEEGKPAAFKGAVGNFTIDASLEKNNFSDNETGKLLITVSGSGNLQLVTPPEIKWPANFEVFDAHVTDNIDNAVFPIRGSKTFEIPFAVQQPGSYTTPQIDFIFFDPHTASYKTVSAKSISFTVSKGQGKTVSEPATEQTEPVSFINNIGKNRGIIILSLAGIILIGFLAGRRKKTTPPSATLPEKKSAVENSSVISSLQNPLSKTEECLHLEECSAFYSVLNKEFKELLARRFSIPAAMINARSVAGIMDNAGTDNTTILQTQQLLRDIELQLYTPFEHNEQFKEMYARAQTLIQILNLNMLLVNKR